MNITHGTTGTGPRTLSVPKTYLATGRIPDEYIPSYKKFFKNKV